MEAAEAEGCLYQVCVECIASKFGCPGQCWKGGECSEYYWTHQELQEVEKEAERIRELLHWR